jgi:hypothetical protein
MKFYGLFSLRKLPARNSLFKCWQAFFMGSVNASSCLDFSFVLVRNFLLRHSKFLRQHFLIISWWEGQIIADSFSIHFFQFDSLVLRPFHFPVFRI